MKNGLQKVFARDGVLFTSVILCAFSFLASVALSFVDKNWARGVVEIFEFVMMAMLFSAFLNHEKNKMKILIGTIIAFFIVQKVNTLFEYLLPAGAKDPSFNIDSIARLVEVIIFFILFVIHLEQNSSNKKVGNKLFISQLLLLAMSIYYIVGIIVNIIRGTEFITIFRGFSNFLLCMAITCLEAKLGLYKVEREKLIEDNMWTEEQKKKLKDEVFGD